MKKRILCSTVILAMLAAMALPVFAETDAPSQEQGQTAEQAASSEEEEDQPDEGIESSEEDAFGSVFETDPFAYGEDEGYAIVPLFAGSSTVDMDASKGYIQIWKILRNRNQTWKLVRDGDYFYFQNFYNNRILQVSGKTASVLPLGTGASYAGTSNQLWKIESAGGGSYYIRSKLNENYVLDVYYSSAENGNGISIFPLHGGANQRFRFVHVTTTEPMDEWGSYRRDCAGSYFDFWDGTADVDWYYADKNAAVYRISSARALAGLSQLVRDGIFQFEGRTVVLTRDLQLANIEWQRIGTPDRPFKGNFDGGGHVIAGLSVTTAEDCDGLFGVVDGGCISNFAVKGSVTADYAAGGAVGQLIRGAVVHIYSEVDISSATDDNAGGIVGRMEAQGSAEHCTYNGRIYADSDQPSRGGIAGYAGGVVRYCVNRGANQANGNHVGGIVGDLHGGKIEYCANYGNVTGGSATDDLGGICGRAVDDGLIFGCHNEGRVDRGSAKEVGGILGKREDSARVFCCINTGDVHGQDNVGGSGVSR